MGDDSVRERNEVNQGVPAKPGRRSHTSAKKHSKGGSSSKPNRQGSAGGVAKPPRPYPRVTLNNALIVAQKIKELNGGNPWATGDVANALSLSIKAPKFFYTAASSRDFGLTLGSRDSERIELTDLGRGVVYAPNAEVEKAKRQEAFLNVEIFRKVLEHYRGSSLPEMKYLGNTLEREFKRHCSFSTSPAQVSLTVMASRHLARGGQRRSG